MKAFVRATLPVLAFIALARIGLPARQMTAQTQEIKVGMIGLDTSHVGAVAFGAKANLATPTSMKSDYRNLLVEVVKFFQTGAPPVPPEETLEMMAFMEAADSSKARGGAPVTLKEVMEKK
jgi:hypothetical protein